MESVALNFSHHRNTTHLCWLYTVDGSTVVVVANSIQVLPFRCCVFFFWRLLLLWMFYFETTILLIIHILLLLNIAHSFDNFQFIFGIPKCLSFGSRIFRIMWNRLHLYSLWKCNSLFRCVRYFMLTMFTHDLNSFPVSVFVCVFYRLGGLSEKVDVLLGARIIWFATSSRFWFKLSSFVAYEWMDICVLVPIQVNVQNSTMVMLSLLVLALKTDGTRAEWKWEFWNLTRIVQKYNKNDSYVIISLCNLYMAVLMYPEP